MTERTTITTITTNGKTDFGNTSTNFGKNFIRNAKSTPLTIARENAPEIYYPGAESLVRDVISRLDNAAGLVSTPSSLVIAPKVIRTRNHRIDDAPFPTNSVRVEPWRSEMNAARICVVTPTGTECRSISELIRSKNGQKSSNSKSKVTSDGDSDGDDETKEDGDREETQESDKDQSEKDDSDSEEDQEDSDGEDGDNDSDGEEEESDEKDEKDDDDKDGEEDEEDEETKQTDGKSSNSADEKDDEDDNEDDEDDEEDENDDDSEEKEEGTNKKNQGNSQKNNDKEKEKDKNKDKDKDKDKEKEKEKEKDKEKDKSGEKIKETTTTKTKRKITERTTIKTKTEHSKRSSNKDEKVLALAVNKPAPNDLEVESVPSGERVLINGGEYDARDLIQWLTQRSRRNNGRSRRSRPSSRSTVFFNQSQNSQTPPKPIGGSDQDAESFEDENFLSTNHKKSGGVDNRNIGDNDDDNDNDDDDDDDDEEEEGDGDDENNIDDRDRDGNYDYGSKPKKSPFTQKGGPLSALKLKGQTDERAQLLMLALTKGGFFDGMSGATNQDASVAISEGSGSEDYEGSEDKAGFLSSDEEDDDFFLSAPQNALSGPREVSQKNIKWLAHNGQRISQPQADNLAWLMARGYRRLHALDGSDVAFALAPPDAVYFEDDSSDDDEDDDVEGDGNLLGKREMMAKREALQRLVLEERLRRRLLARSRMDASDYWTRAFLAYADHLGMSLGWRRKPAINFCLARALNRAAASGGNGGGSNGNGTGCVGSQSSMAGGSGSGLVGLFSSQPMDMNNLVKKQDWPMGEDIEVIAEEIWRSYSSSHSSCSDPFSKEQDDDDVDDDETRLPMVIEKKIPVLECGCQECISEFVAQGGVVVLDDPNYMGGEEVYWLDEPRCERQKQKTQEAEKERNGGKKKRVAEMSDAELEWRLRSVDPRRLEAAALVLPIDGPATWRRAGSCAKNPSGAFVVDDKSLALGRPLCPPLLSPIGMRAARRCRLAPCLRRCISDISSPVQSYLCFSF